MTLSLQNVEIEGKVIGDGHPTYFIADIAANHDGDLERAKDLIYLAAEAGADAAKFQHFLAETIVSDFGFAELGDDNASHQKNWNRPVTEVYRDASVPLAWTEELVATCKKAGITFMTSPYDIDVVNKLDKYLPAYKIGSGDITWLEIIELIASKAKPYILATGASDIEEVKKAVSTVLPLNKQFILMQCNTNYTGSLENLKHINLAALHHLRLEFPGVILGLSDHTPGHSTVLGAICYGARAIEKHFTDDTSRSGPDHQFSMSPETWRDMVDRSRELENAMGNGVKKVEANEVAARIVQRRSIRLRREMHAGDVVRREDLIPLRPCPEDAICPSEISNIIGKALKANKVQGDYLRITDLI